MHPEALILVKSVVQALEGAFPQAVIQLLRPSPARPVHVVALVINGPDPIVHQVSITVPIATPGKLCLQWYEETGRQDPESPLLARYAGTEGLRDLNVFRSTRHIMAAHWTNQNAIHGWIARTRHHIDPNNDQPAWCGLPGLKAYDPDAVRYCWDRGEREPDVLIDRRPGTFILRPGDPNSPVCV